MLVVARIVQFSSPQAFEQAIRAVRSRPFRLDKVMLYLNKLAKLGTDMFAVLNVV